MVLRSLTLGLLLGGNPDPDANIAGICTGGDAPIHYLKCIHFEYIIKHFEFNLSTTLATVAALMKSPQYVEESALAALAKKYREASGKTRAQAAREMGIKQPSIFHAEESPEHSFTKLRRRMIEAFSNVKVSGPFYRLDEE